jgi:hypothetical protein
METPSEGPAEQSSSVELLDAPLEAVLVPPRTAADQPPLRWRELLVVLALVVLCDLTIYRGHGFAGYALLFAAAPLLLALGAPRLRGKGNRTCKGDSPIFADAKIGTVPCWIVAAMLVALAAKMLWCGSVLLVASGFALTVALAAALAGWCPYVLEVGIFASQTIQAGYEGLIHYGRRLDQCSPTISKTRWIAVALPLAAFLVFGLLFVFANPDLVASLGAWMEWLGNVLHDRLLEFVPSLWEILFWAATLWIVVGLLRPVVRPGPAAAAARGPSPASAPAPLYAALRNMLLTVIVLFAVYLAFEFHTLWFRVFPKGFYYSGYAHEGAAWLAGALALATVVLSLVFRGAVLLDPRLPKLRWLAWAWSLENILLSIAVYHRLYIYIGFNGMTYKRTVGIFGMSAVVVGFILVVWKITRNRDFVWLVRRHLWTLALAVYLFALTPVDAIVTRYNVRRILSGDPAPSVQITVHPIDSEGVWLLAPLLDCDDAIIREGLGAMLSERQAKAEQLAVHNRQQGWTTFQIADSVVLQSLRDAGGRWADFTADPARRADALKRFHEYAYQWY